LSEKEVTEETFRTKKARSPFRLAMRRLKRHKTAMVGLYVLIALYLGAILADFVAPYTYDSEARKLSYAPPTRIHFVDAEGKFHLRPFIYVTSYEFDEIHRRVFAEDKSKRYPIELFARGDRHKLLGLFPTRVHLFGADEPARIFLIGADSRGRDLFSRILYGGRISLSVGLVGVAISFLLGMTVGGVAGYFGGWVDNGLMRLCEMIMTIPGFYLMLALRAAFPPTLPSTSVYLMIVVIMSFIGWAGLARVVRGMVLSISSKDYVTAAKAVGGRDIVIIFRHVLPNTLSYVIVSLTLSIPGYILGESALSLLGLGIQDPHASWGNLLSDAMNVSEIRFHPWMLIPGAFIFAAVMAFNFLGDGLRDAFDPRMEVGKG